MAIELYSTELRRKTPLETKVPGKVDMYVCGPTVYDSCHIGHARPAVVFDTIRRYLEYSGLSVTFISNVTDIDDKIINRSENLGVSWASLASRYQDEYERDMAALGVRSPTIRPRATEHIAEMIALARDLEEKGVAYRTPRGLWFDVTKFADYGRLSGRTVDDDNTEHRVEQDPDKRHAQDFALWKVSKPGEPSWESPWGSGRPGWHLECSAMSGKYCNHEIDIHGGGADLAFPHHENELAQSEALTGRRFVRYWLHNGFITVGKTDGEESKMGKSKGNAFWLKDAFHLVGPAALRLWILGTHYRMPLLYKPDLLVNSVNALARIHNGLDELSRALGSDTAVKSAVSGSLADEAVAAVADFKRAMDDDFNTPQALAVLYELIGKANSGIKAGAPQEQLKAVQMTLFSLMGVLGLPLERPESGGADADVFVKLLVDLRTQARKDKDFALSDRIRDSLKGAGVEINDRGGETTWTKSP